MNPNDSSIDDLDLALALRRLADTAVVPPGDPARELALMAAFDAAAVDGRLGARRIRLPYWGMAGLTAAAALLMAIGLMPVRAGRHGTPPGGDATTHKPLPSSIRGVQPEPQPPGEFVLVPAAAGLPAMESGSLVRMDVPVSLLPSFGITPPPGRRNAVRADVIIAQDGLPRAVRLVN